MKAPRKDPGISVACEAWRRSAIVAALVASGIVVGAAPLAAQFNSSQMRDRYNRTTKGSSASIDDSVKNLQSDDADKRLEAVKALGTSNDAKAVEYLVGALGDADMRVRAKSVDMLGEMRATNATPVLVQQLFLRTTEPQMKQRILVALGKVGDARAAKPIMEFLQRDLDPSTRGTAIFALGDLGSPEAIETLEQIADSDSDDNVRRLARDAASKVREHQASVSREAKAPAEKFLPKPPPEEQR
jgi:HEAT repeat protein